MNSRWASAPTTCVLVAVIAALALAGAAFAADGGNSTNRKLCQHDGWMFWLQADQTAFKSPGDCRAYDKKGGTFTSPYPAAQSLCASFGGTFGHDNQLVGGDPDRPYLWTCNNLPSDFPFPSGNDALAAECFADGAAGPFGYNPPQHASTCFS